MQVEVLPEYFPRILGGKWTDATIFILTFNLKQSKTLKLIELFLKW